MDNPTQIQSVLNLYNGGYVAYFDDGGNVTNRVRIEEMCQKDIEVLLHEADYSYSAIIRRYQTHRDYMRFINEMTMSAVVRHMKGLLVQNGADAAIADLRKQISTLEKENDALLKENLSLKHTDDEPSYDELKNKKDEAEAEVKRLKQTIKDLNATLKRANDKYDDLEREYKAQGELVMKDEAEPEKEQQAEVPMPKNTEALQEIDIHTMCPQKFVYHLMINDICYCTIYRTFKNPPVDDNRQWSINFINVNTLSEAVNDILNYDTGTATVLVGTRCIYDGVISKGDYEVIDHILNGIINEIGEDIMERPVYINFGLEHGSPLIADLNGGFYFTFTFYNGNRPVTTKIMRIDAPIIQAVKACHNIIGKKTADPTGQLYSIDSIDIRQIYEVHHNINAANIVKIGCNEMQQHCVEGMWYDPMAPSEPDGMEGRRYFINFYSGVDHTSIGYVIKANSFDELKQVITKGFTNTSEFVRVYDADTNAFIDTIYSINEHK